MFPTQKAIIPYCPEYLKVADRYPKVGNKQLPCLKISNPFSHSIVRSPHNLSGVCRSGKVVTYCILSNISVLAIATAFPEEYGNLLIKIFHSDQIEQREKQLFGLSTTDLTCNLLASWHLPKPLIQALRVSGNHVGGKPFCRTAGKIRKIIMYIIMLIGNESADGLVQAFDAGADDYIIKLFTAKVLQARISSGERLIRSQQIISKDREVIQRYAAKLASTNRKLQDMAMTDFLTGLPNRQSALQRLKNLVSEVQRYGEPLSILMIDIDRFKLINDTSEPG